MPSLKESVRTDDATDTLKGMSKDLQQAARDQQDRAEARSAHAHARGTTRAREGERLVADLHRIDEELASEKARAADAVRRVDVALEGDKLE